MAFRGAGLSVCRKMDINQMKSETVNTHGAVGQRKTCDCCSETGEGIHVEIFDTFDELTPMQQQWDDFVEDNGGDIFLTYDWCRVWWKYYGGNRELKVFVFRNSKKLVGIIPMFFERIWLGPIAVRVGKIVGSDFSLFQFSIPINSSYMRVVVEKLCERIGELSWDIIYIGPIAGLYKDSTVLKDTLVEFFGATSTILVKKENIQTYFQLTDGWDTYLSNLSKRDRGDIRRNYRYVGKIVDCESESVHSDFVDTNHIREAFKEFAEMHQLHWHRAGKAGHFGDWPDAHMFHLELAEVQQKRGRLRLLKVHIDGHCLGYEYCYKVADNYFEILNARSDSTALKHISLGKIVFSELVKKAMGEHVQYIDSMRGKYEHKLRLGGGLFPVANLYITRRKPFIVIRVAAFRFLARFINLCYYRIWFTRIAPRLPLKRRSLWRRWIKSKPLV